MGKKRTIKTKDLDELADLDQLPSFPDEELLEIAKLARKEQEMCKEKITEVGLKIQGYKVLSDRYSKLEKTALATIGHRKGRDCPARQNDPWYRAWACRVGKKNTMRSDLNSFYATFCRQCTMTEAQIKAKLVFNKMFDKKGKI